MHSRSIRYDFETAQTVAHRQLGIDTDVFLFGLDALGLLLWRGDVRTMRAGVVKVLDGHRRLLAQVRQGEVMLDRCVTGQHTHVALSGEQRARGMDDSLWLWQAALGRPLPGMRSCTSFARCGGTGLPARVHGAQPVRCVPRG